MKISIIMPSLNVGKYIGKCLQSIVNQTLKDIEIICVDGGSTDCTLEIINEFVQKDSRIKLINSPVKSYGYQMNLGLKAALGEYIGIVETDDFIDENMFEQLYSYTLIDKVDFVKSSYFEYANKKENELNVPLHNPKISKKHGKIINLSEEFEYRLADNMHIWSGIYRREFLLNNSLFFNETLGASFQDVSFSILVGLMADTCIYVDKCFYHYRVDNENSSVKSNSKITCVCDEYKYINKFLENKNKLNSETQKTLNIMKLETYNWNYMRLSKESKCKFIDAIADEMSVYNFDELDDEYKKIYLNLTDKQRIPLSIEENNIKIAKNKEIIKQISNDKTFNVAGAGVKFKILICIQKYLNKKIIESVSDNSIKLQGKSISGYTVLSIKEAVRKNDNKWLVASRYYDQDIKNQLISLGVNEKNIISLKELFGLSALINYNLI